MNNFTPPHPNQDERVMAALAHVSAILPLMGTIATIVIWVTQREKSRYVAFQALQAIAYQLTMIVAWMIGMGCYFCSFFATFLSIPLVSSSGTTPPVNALAELGFIIPFLSLGIIFLGGLAFIVYGIVGAINAFQGKPFRYVFIGYRVERFMQQEENKS
ncbi:MAG: DUF4870 domain-containing protein [Anaerolineales bacterium]|jgi:uncharacterized Tic20 family protein